jgi:hypothetical protein
MGSGTELSIGARVGQFFSERKEQVLGAWVAAVRADPALEASERLSDEELRDNFEQIMDYLDETLWSAFDQEVKHGSKLAAAIHGKNRWSQSYSINEILRELSSLRAVMIAQLFEFYERNADIGAAGCIFISSIVHRYVERHHALLRGPVPGRQVR